MNLRDMLDNISEKNLSEFMADNPTGPATPKAPSSQHRKIDRDITGRSAEQTEVSMDKLKNSQNPAIQDLFKKAEMLNKLLDNQATAQATANLIQKLQKTEPQAEQMEDLDLAEALSAEIPINVLSNIMGDDTLVNLMRQALRQIQNERGINKRFMPALKIFLSPYVNILGSGFTGYNQIMALEKALVKTNTGATDPSQDQDIAEPSEEEILAYGTEHNLPTVTPQQKQEVVELIKQEKQAQSDEINNDDEQQDPNNKEPKEKVKMAASKYSEGVDEIKRLAQIIEAMSDDMPSKAQVMKCCKDGMSVSEICKKYPDCDQDKLKAMCKDCKEDLKEAKDDMPSKAQVMKCCKDGMSVSEICKKFPDCDQDKLKELCKECMAEIKESVSEAMSDAYGEDQMVAPVELNPDSPEQVEGSVEFKQHKNTDKGSVSVEASGETMQDLADVLKLAGLTLPQDMHKDEPEAHDEPEAEMPCDSEEPKDDKVMVVSPKDASYSTDKQVLVNYLKDKLKKSIS